MTAMTVYNSTIITAVYFRTKFENIIHSLNQIVDIIITEKVDEISNKTWAKLFWTKSCDYVSNKDHLQLTKSCQSFRINKKSLTYHFGPNVRLDIV